MRLIHSFDFSRKESERMLSSNLVGKHLVNLKTS